jgi:hypothetical protein
MAFEMRTSAEANSTDPYRPKTIPEKAGAVGGVNAAVPADPNYVFASTIKAGLERTPYPTGGGGGAASLDTVAAVECDATLKV